MRVVSLSVLAIVALVRAQAQERPEDLLKNAIQAAGGADVLARYPAGRVVGKGTMTFAGVETPFTFEQAYSIPGRFRTLIRAEVKGQKWELLQVISDGTAKQTINGRLIPVGDAELKEMQNAALVSEIAQFTTLTTDRKFTLRPDKQVKGPDVGGIIVYVRGHPDHHLLFDRKSGHLTRIGFKGTDPDAAKEAEVEITFSDFKTVAGLTRPTTSIVTKDGKKAAELIVEKFTPVEKIDPKAFTIDD